MILIKDIMISNVYTLHEEATVLEAMEKLSEYRINGMPIVNEQQQVIGYISDGDIMRFLGIDEQIPNWVKSLANQYGISVEDTHIEENFEHNVERVATKKVKEIATKKIISLKEDDNIIIAAKMLAKEKLKKLPVIKNGKLVGIVSEGDVIRLAYSVFLKNQK